MAIVSSSNKGVLRAVHNVLHLIWLRVFAHPRGWSTIGINRALYPMTSVCRLNFNKGD